MNLKKSTLSVIIIARNEEPRIKKCIEALDFADEILVIDNNSTDKTAEVASRHDARVVSLHELDFAKLRNIGADTAESSWILYVDADETVTPQLASSIRKAIQTDEELYGGYELYRRNHYLGARWPKSEWMLRLIRKNALQGWHGRLHETALVKGSVGKLEGILLHDTHRTLSEMVDKTNEWSETEAALRYSIHHPSITWWRILRVILTGFWHSFVAQGGWRAGTVGWIESIYQGFSMFVTYAKLWELQQKDTHVK